jgi:outer membrane immunogenic protein
MKRLACAKGFLYASAALAWAGMAGTASAADLARRPPPAPVTKAPAYVPFTWTGFYVGVNGGYGFGRSKWSGLPSSFDVNGGLVGGQVGYNWQFGQFVYGLEGDGDWTDLRGTANVAACLNGTGTTTCRTRNDFISTVRGRVGYAMDRWLPYATGGLAVGNIRATVPGFTGIDKTDAGWTVGGGVEYALAPSWSVKAEYLYVDLGKDACSTMCGLAAGNNVSLTTNIVRGGINYRF